MAEAGSPDPEIGRLCPSLPVRMTRQRVNRPEDLADVLFRTAVYEASRRGYRFGDGAESGIRMMADRGARRLLELSPDLETVDAHLLDAAKAFERLIVEMAAAARSIPGYAQAHPGVIGEQTLTLALSRLCPLSPIC